MIKYILVDIGCLECGENSSIIGVFDDESIAKSAREQARKAQYLHWSGQHDFVVFHWNEQLNNTVNIPDYE